MAQIQWIRFTQLAWFFERNPVLAEEIPRLISHYRQTPFTLRDGLSEWQGRGGLCMATTPENLLGMFRLDPTRTGFHLSSFIIHPTLRGQGLGPKLLHQGLRDYSQERIQLRVRQENHSAMKMYWNAGFQEKAALEGRYEMQLR